VTSIDGATSAAGKLLKFKIIEYPTERRESNQPETSNKRSPFRNTFQQNAGSNPSPTSLTGDLK